MNYQRILPLFCLAFLALACGEKNQENMNEAVIASHVIVGEDDRQLVEGRYNSYNRKVGQLVFERENNQVTICTATSIADRYIITAAHCFYNDGQRLKNAFFYPGRRNEESMPFDRFPVIEVFHPDAYIPNSNTVTNSSHDIAVAKVGLNSEGRGLHHRVGSLGLWAMNQITNQHMKTIGYPGDKGHFHQYMEDDCQAHNDNTLYFSSTCDVFQGQSGSPALFYHEATDAYYLRGIIVSETETENIAAKLTTTRKEIIDAIIDNQFTSFQQPTGQQWSSYPVQRDLRVRVIIHNRCHYDVLVAYHLFDENTGTNGFYPILPGERQEVTKTIYGDYRLHVRDRQHRVLIGANSSHQHTLHNNQFNFQSFLTTSWGDQVHTLCQ